MQEHAAEAAYLEIIAAPAVPFCDECGASLDPFEVDDGAPCPYCGAHA